MEIEFVPKTYRRRWAMLFISSTIIALKGFNKSCFGPSNQVLAKYFDVEPWKIDWFVNIQSVVFFPFSILLCLITTKMGYRFKNLLFVDF